MNLIPLAKADESRNNKANCFLEVAGIFINQL